MFSDVKTTAGYMNGTLLDVGDVLLVPLKYRLGKTRKKIKRNINAAANEIDELQQLSHPNLINFLCATNDDSLDAGYLIYENLSREFKSLSDYSSKDLKSIYSLNSKLELVDKVCEGLSYTCTIKGSFTAFYLATAL